MIKILFNFNLWEQILGVSGVAACGGADVDMSTTRAHRDLFPQTLYRFIKLYKQMDIYVLILNIILCYIELCIVWMIRYDTYRDTFDPIHDTYRRYVSDQIYDVTRHIFDKLVCTTA